MSKIIYNLVFNRKKRLNSKGTALVQIEAYQHRKKKYFTTGVYLHPEEWDARRNMVRKHPQAEALNRFIRERLMEIEQKELDLWKQRGSISLEELKTALNKEEPTFSFFTFWNKEVIGSSLKESTKKNHLTTLEQLRRFKQDVTFSELDFTFVSDFEQHLCRHGYHVNTIAKHLRHLKKYVNIAINKGYMEIQQYPFRKFRIHNIEGHHTHLSPAELARLEQLSLPSGKQRHRPVLDAFLFCCYAGLRYSDFVSLRADNFVEIAGHIWLVYTSVKTHTEVRLPLYLLFDGKALKLLERYRTDLPAFFRLNNNSNVNKILLLLTRLAKIEKHVSFHTARHTNATLLIYNGVNITTVQRLLGHKSVKTTQLYTSIMDATIVKDLQRNGGNRVENR